jgi:hypothetical protein
MAVRSGRGVGARAAAGWVGASRRSSLVETAGQAGPRSLERPFIVGNKSLPNTDIPG